MEQDLITISAAAELLGGVSSRAVRELLRRRGVALYPVGAARPSGASSLYLVSRSAVVGLAAELEREAAELAQGTKKRRGGVARVAGSLSRGGRRCRAGSAELEQASKESGGV
jgi:hypothetical protein